MSVRDRVRQFIVEELNWNGAPGELTDDFPLLDTGTVDSMGVFDLVSFLEEEWGVQIPDQELVPANFRTIASIARLVESRSEG